MQEKIYELESEIAKIEKSIEINNSNPIVLGEVVDLYKTDKDSQGRYTVCLHDTKTIIGEVGCTGNINNIHYAITPEYRNKGYGFQAVLTMLNYLILNNIDNIILIIDKDNVSSIRIAEKLKTVFPDFNIEERERRYIEYHFSLNKSIDEKPNVSR